MLGNLRVSSDVFGMVLCVLSDFHGTFQLVTGMAARVSISRIHPRTCLNTPVSTHL